MIHNVTYNNPKVDREIAQAVGPAFGMLQRIRIGGTGSPKLLIREASEAFQPFLGYNQDLVYANIELRPKGMILRFRHLLETMAWIVPGTELHWLWQNPVLTLRKGSDELQLEPAAGVAFNYRYFVKAELLWGIG